MLICLFQSITYAPENGPELSLAFANRSACLYHNKNYEKCLQDIKLALNYRYPKNLEYKLLQRKGQCLTKLKRFNEAEEALIEANKALDLAPSLSNEKREQLQKDIKSSIR